MRSILDRLIEKIRAANIDPNPSENIYMEELFEPAVYKEIIKRLPEDDCYDFINHPDAKLEDGTVTRKLLDLTDDTINRLNSSDRDFWLEMKDIFTSTALQNAIVQKFSARIKNRFTQEWPDMVTVPIFYRDFPGYYISPHTDAPTKVATMQFYFPKDESQIHLGTAFLRRVGNQFQVLKTNVFKPNSAYAFVRTDDSWHYVKKMSAHEDKRNTLALTIYEKGQEYKSDPTKM